MKIAAILVLFSISLVVADLPHHPRRRTGRRQQRRPVKAQRRGRQQNVLVDGFPRTVEGGIDFSNAVRNDKGQLCVYKEGTVQSIQKDPILNCVHKNVEKCHYTYVTYFKPSQEEICEENFEKSCQITFKQEATTETVRKCYRPQTKVCNGQGPIECRIVYESSCTTRYVDKGNGRFVGDTACEKLPIEICGAGCVVEQGPEECHDKEQSSLVNIPEEICDLNPQKTCRFGTKLVPSLKPKHECTTIPREVCNLAFTAPRPIDKPLREEWCLDESPVQRDQTYDEALARGPILDQRQDDAIDLRTEFQSDFPFEALIQDETQISPDFNEGDYFIDGDYNSY